MQDFQLDLDDDYNGMCGEVYMTVKRCLVFHCLLCDKKYKNGLNYLMHVNLMHGYDGGGGGGGDAVKNESEPKTLYISEETEEFFENLSEFSLADEKRSMELIAGRCQKNRAIGTFKTGRPKEPPSTSLYMDEILTNSSDRMEPAADSNISVSEEAREKTFFCRFCSAIYTNRKEFLKHKIVHEKTHTCPTCFQVFKYGSTLARHVTQEHDDIQEILHRCYVCSKAFATYDELSVHLTLHSSDEKETKVGQTTNYERPYKCHICGFRMKDSGNILRHVRRHSEENKKFQCSQCGRKFFDSGDLKTHARRHTGERPFLCSNCGQSFVTVSQLYTHRRIHHTVRERKFKCSYCPASYMDKSTLKKHLSSHAIIMPTL